MRKKDTQISNDNLIILEGTASGDIMLCCEGLSFWGGVDPTTGIIIDVHHPNHGECISNKILMMPTSRGSCSGSGVLLELALKGKAPAALIFNEYEQVLTLGAVVADRIFRCNIPVISLTGSAYQQIALAKKAVLHKNILVANNARIALKTLRIASIETTKADREMLNGGSGPATKMAMDIICLMAMVDQTSELVSVSKGHIDGCILAHSANLIFAEKMAELGARVVIPTTINAISVDRENWQTTDLPVDFGQRASRLADAYVVMGAQPTFTCAPYLLDDAPVFGEKIGWSESNAVIFANTVIGAQTQKHPDYLDLFIAMTGRAPFTGVYTSKGRRAGIILDISVPKTIGVEAEVFWPLVGWVAGNCAPDRIPLIKGLEDLNPTLDNLKALCAAFGTTSGVPMLHISGHTPESHIAPIEDALNRQISLSELLSAWYELNQGETQIDLVAIGSPHASIDELRRVSMLLADRKCHPDTQTIITVGRQSLGQAREEGLEARLTSAGVQLMSDLCWCSIIEPISPSKTGGLITNSGKYAHYAHGLCGRHSRLGSLHECIEASVSGAVSPEPPSWLIQ